MSRLDDHRRKQFLHKIIFFLVCLVGLIVLLATVGFNALINSSLFVRNLLSSGNTDQTEQVDDNFFGTLYVDSIPTATNSARIIVSGSASNYDTIEYYINEDKVKTITIANVPSFSNEIGDLKKGVNNIYIKALAKSAKKEKDSEVFNVVYSDEKPKLDITEPLETTKTSKSEINVIGETDKDIEIKINQSPVIVDATGKFQTSVRLKEGENKIEVTAIDQAGNSEKRTLTVEYRRDD